MSSRRPIRRLTAAALVLSAFGGGPAAQTPPAGNPDAAVIKDFLQRVHSYHELHEKLEQTLVPLPKEAPPEAITAHQRALERLMTRARAGARRGDIFTDPIRAYFRRQLSRVFTGADGITLRGSIMDEDTRAVRLTVNGRYPETVPLSSVPAQVLLVLPRLPESLEYRFVGERLMLLDVHARTVVDFFDQAIPR